MIATLGGVVNAPLRGPLGWRGDPSGDVYVADSADNRIQEIAGGNGTQWGQSMTADDIYTVAGSATGTSGNAGDGGLATAALMANAESISLDPEGDLYITDNTNDTIREVASAIPAAIPPAPGQASSLALAPSGGPPGGLTVTQPGGAQVTFWAQSGGSCASSYVATGSYCILPQDKGATLSYNSGTYTFSPSPGTTYTYNSTGQLTSEADAAGDTLTVAYHTPAPGSGQCPSTASSCDTVTSASGHALVIGLNASALVTSVSDPMGRTWSYAYTGSGLTSVTDPMGNKTSYTYGAGSTGNPLLANDLLTITNANAQPGGPDAGKSTVNVYNAAGQVTTQTDPMGNVTRFNYCVNAADGDCMNTATGTGTVSVTDPDGNTTVDDYTQGALAAESVWTGSTLTSQQDYAPDTTAGGTSGGTLLDTSATDGNGNTTTQTFDPAGNLVTQTSPTGVGTQTATTSQWSTALDQPSCTATAQAATPCSSTQTGPTPVAPGAVITPPASAPPQGVTYTLYDTDGSTLYATTGVFEPGSNTAAYQSTAYTLYKGNSVTLGSTNITCTTTPPSASLPCATINPDGVVTQLAYDSGGDLASASTPDGNGSQVAETTSLYNADGEVTSQVAPDGNIAGANAGNYTTVTAWNTDAEKTSVTQADGSGATVTPRATIYGYDGDGNQTTLTDPRGYITTTTFNADDEPTLLTDPDGNAALTCYDGDGNDAQSVPPAGVATGSLTPASCPTVYPAGYSDRLAADATTKTYDAAGDVTQTTTPAPAGQSGSETTYYVYDANGNLTTTTAPPASNGGPNQVTTDTYNTADELAAQTTGSGTSAAATVSDCYDPDGDVTSTVAADGNSSGTATCETASPWVVSSSSYPTQAAYQTTSSYDSAGEEVSTTSPATAAAPSGATTAATYDPAGNKLTATDPDGVTVTWTYTPPGQTASVSYSGSSAHSVGYTYDADGNTTAMTDATGSSSYYYDPFDELTSATNGASKTVGYGYDPDGDTTGVTYPLPAAATWAATNTVAYGYDHADNLTSVTDFNNHQITITPNADSLPASETLGTTGDTITTSYDNTDNPSAITLKNSSSTLQSFTYSDAQAGNILSETDTPTSAKSPAVYTYDAKGRVTSMTPGTGSALNYGFDASSNLTTLPTGATGTYDHASELTSSVLAGTTTSYTYNPDGEQLSAKQASATITSAAWNGARQLTSYDAPAANMTAATYDGNGQRATMTTASGTQNYTWDAAGDLLMDTANAYIYTGSTAPAEQASLATGTTTYLNTDSLGSVRGIISSSGALTASTSYDAWGNPQTTGGLTASTPFGYAGAYTDPDGLLYLINRYYNPATGQFISVDPDVAATGEPYGYAGGDPVDNADPDGLYLMAETGAGARIGSAQYLETIVPRINYYNPVSSQIPRTPAQKRTPPKVRKAVKKKTTKRKAKAARPSREGAVPCTGINFRLGACLSERGAAGTNAQQVKQSLIGAGAIIVGALTGGLGDAIGGALGIGTEAEEGAVTTESVSEEAAEACESFTAGTKVLLASRAAVPIASLTPGDKVLATNTGTGKTQGEPVTAVMVHHDTDRYNLTIRAGHRAAVIHTTRNHLFWDLSRNKWVKAGSLRQGDHLRTPAHATVTVIGGRAPADAVGWMWDLSVPGGNDHDFYIDVVNTAVLVHNCPMMKGESRIAKATGYTRNQIGRAIETVKQGSKWRGFGPIRNPDVWIDSDTGEVYPPLPNGDPADDSIGNIFDYLP